MSVRPAEPSPTPSRNPSQEQSQNPDGARKTRQWSERLSFSLPYLIGLVGLLVFGRQIWQFLIIPVGAMIFFGSIAAKWVKGPTRVMVPAFTVQAGLAFWFFLLASGGSPGWVDFFITAVGMALIITVRHWAPAAIMLVYQLLIMLANIGTLITLSPGSPAQKAGAAVIILRLTAVTALVAGLGTMLGRAREARAAKAAAPAIGPIAAVATATATTPTTAGSTASDLSPQAAEELRRLAALVAEGVITQEEFEAKKRQILGL